MACGHASTKTSRTSASTGGLSSPVDTTSSGSSSDTDTARRLPCEAYAADVVLDREQGSMMVKVRSCPSGTGPGSTASSPMLGLRPHVVPVVLELFDFQRSRKDAAGNFLNKKRAVLADVGILLIVTHGLIPLVIFATSPSRQMQR